MLNAIMTIIEEQRTMSWSLPKGSSIILTNNPDGGDFNISISDDALKGRFSKIVMAPDVDSWCAWAINNYIPEKFIDFLRNHKEIIEGSGVNMSEKVENGKKTKQNSVKNASLRDWTRFFLMCRNYDNIDIKEGENSNWFNIVLPLGENNLPYEHMMLLHAFIKKGLDKLPGVYDIINSTNIKNTIKEIKSHTKQNQSAKALISNRLKDHIDNNYKEYSELNAENIRSLLREEELFDLDIALNIVISCINGDKDDIFKLGNSENSDIAEKIMYKK
jgi:viroplasmin and RNaseH domain-containing protein